MLRMLSHPRRAAIGTLLAASANAPGRTTPISRTRCSAHYFFRGGLSSDASELGDRREGGGGGRGIRELSSQPPRLSAEVAKAVAGYVFPDKAVSYTRKDAILYALGIGETGAEHVYEGHPQFKPFPTLPLILSFKGTASDIVPFTLGQVLVPPLLHSLPLSSIVHGNQCFELHQALPVEGRGLVNRSRVVELTDKGSGALLCVLTHLVGPDGTLYASHEHGLFLKGMGNFGGERGAKHVQAAPPHAPPDAQLTLHTLPHQALLYRLSGDYNPLHADPSFARSVGFPRPILHGLCTFALVARALISLQPPLPAPSPLRSLKGRFAAPVFPGESVTVQVWHGRGEAGGVQLRAVVREGAGDGGEGSGGEREVFSGGHATFHPARLAPDP